MEIFWIVYIIGTIAALAVFAWGLYGDCVDCGEDITVKDLAVSIVLSLLSWLLVVLVVWLTYKDKVIIKGYINEEE